MTCKSIDVMICTRNNANTLRETLAALEHLDPPPAPWRLTVVNNGSTDRTAEVLANCSPILPLRVVEEQEPGLSVARNRGLSMLDPESLVVFTDDDVIPTPGWLQAYWRAAVESAPRTFFGGPIESIFLGRVPEATLLSLAPASIRGFEPSTSDMTYARTFLGANWSCPAELLAESGGFSSQNGLNSGGRWTPKTGEEAELQERLRALGCQGRFVAEARLGHKVPSSKATAAVIAARCGDVSYTAAYFSDQPTGRKLFGVSMSKLRRLTAEALKYAGARAKRENIDIRRVYWRKSLGAATGQYFGSKRTR